MSRNRPVASLNECLNPEYLSAWGGGPAVKDAIDFSIESIAARARRRHNRGYEVHVILPDYTGKRSIMEHIFMALTRKFTGYHIKLEIGTEKKAPKDILVDFVPFTTVRRKGTLPVLWNDDFSDFTWEDVIRHPEYYSSSSTDVWPPSEYSMRAQRDKMQRLTDERRRWLNPNIGRNDLY